MGDRAVALLCRAVGTPAVATSLLSLGLALLGTLLVTRLPSEGSPLPGPVGAGLALAVLALTASLVLAELGQANVELRQQSYSFSLVGLPLVLGVLYLPALWVVGARLVAAIIAFRIQRSAPVKTVYNSAAYLLDVALVLAVIHFWTTPSSDLTARTALTTYLALVVVDAVMTALVLIVIRINVGPLTLGDLRESYVPAFVTVTVATSLGLLCAVLLQAGPVGAVLLAVVAAGSAVAYRGYLVLRRRHSDLRRVQSFMEGNVSGQDKGAVAADMVDGVRELLRADTVRLVWEDRDGERQSYVSVDDPAQHRRPLTPPPPGTVGLVPATTEDYRLRAWLEALPAREALVVDLGAHGGNGLLVATDRLGGEVSHFSTEDAAFATALVAHLVVRLRNTELVDRLRWEATHDGLTGLPNRRVLLAALEFHLPPTASQHRAPPVPEARAPVPEARAVVLVMGLDNLHEVNDTLGHAVGDELLVEISKRLLRLPLPGATVARLAGEFFAVSLPLVRMDEVTTIAQRLRDTTSEPVTVPGAVVSVSARVGVAEAQAGTGAAELLRRADTALACARVDGRTVAIYDPPMDSGRAERLALLGDLHRALEDRGLDVHYQPKLDLVRGRVSGVEALVRWQHPVLGAISPAVFVPLAESAGLVDRLTDLVLADALRQVCSWGEDGLDLTVAVNLSARSLDDTTLPQRVARALASAGVPPRRLVLEITETSIMGSPERTLPVLHAISQLGVGLSLDDFGTGHSSLAYLRRLPVDELKVDRSFVMALDDTEDLEGVAMVRSILGLARGRNLSVVAEGVESVRAMAVLRELGCDQVQGYLVSRPVPAARIPAAVRAIDADPAFVSGVPSPRPGSVPV